MSATSPRSMPMPSTTSSTIASAADLMSSARSGGDAIWASALMAASSMRASACGGGAVAVAHPGRPSDAGGSFRFLDREGVGARRQVGPMHLPGIEAALERGLQDREIRRDVEIARRIERGMPDLENLAAGGAAFHPRDLGQDRISHELEGLGDQSGADQPGRVARPERDHAPAPALR